MTESQFELIGNKLVILNSQSHGRNIPLSIEDHHSSSILIRITGSVTNLQIYAFARSQADSYVRPTVSLDSLVRAFSGTGAPLNPPCLRLGWHRAPHLVIDVKNREKKVKINLIVVVSSSLNSFVVLFNFLRRRFQQCQKIRGGP